MRQTAVAEPITHRGTEMGSRGRMRVVAASIAALAGLTAAPVAGHASTSSTSTRSVEPAGLAHSNGTMSPAAAKARQHGALVPDEAGLAKLKAQAAVASPAARAASSTGSAGATGTAAPTINKSWAGVFSTNFTPSDSTGAIGPTRYIELTNDRWGIYSRTSNTPVATGSIDTLAGETGNEVFDPQIIWDASTGRFYYAFDDVVTATDNRLAIGWSTTNTPAGAADFCHYTIPYGSDFPDFPKLGDTKDFMLLGVNVFDATNVYVGSDALAVTKPAAGTTCPDAANVTLATQTGLMDSTGQLAFTPVPANQIDGTSTGWILARALSFPSTGATFFTQFKVTKNADGSAHIPQTGVKVQVPAYLPPANAVQKGATQLLDTSDARPTQVVASIDPDRGNVTTLWFQHTVAGGAGAKVAYYEENPATRTMVQSSTFSSDAFYFFNAAISSDRVARGTTRQFGSSSVLTFAGSSSNSDAQIWVFTQHATDTPTAPVLLHSSTTPDIDFACTGGADICRWGDYAAATPDPAPPSGATEGRVWSTQMWNGSSTNTGIANWRTWNSIVSP
jgi:hypothetical protein